MIKQAGEWHPSTAIRLPGSRMLLASLSFHLRDQASCKPGLEASIQVGVGHQI